MTLIGYHCCDCKLLIERGWYQLVPRISDGAAEKDSIYDHAFANYPKSAIVSLVEKNIRHFKKDAYYVGVYTIIKGKR